MNPHTHLHIDRTLCGEPVALADGRASVRLSTTPSMAADDRGLVHGGFVFSAADYAAMLAVNHPHVVLGAAECRFTAPVQVGQAVVVDAEVASVSGRKHRVEVRATADGVEVLTGTFTAFVLDHHVLDRAAGR